QFGFSEIESGFSEIDDNSSESCSNSAYFILIQHILCKFSEVGGIREKTDNPQWLSTFFVRMVKYKCIIRVKEGKQDGLLHSRVCNKNFFKYFWIFKRKSKRKLA